MSTLTVFFSFVFLLTGCIQILLNREALKLPSEESGIQSLAKSIIDVCGHYAERSMGVQ